MPKILKIGKSVPALIPYLIAETVLEKAGIEPTQDIVDWITSFMNYQFNINEGFRKSVKSKAKGGNYGRDFLYAFIEHWVKGKTWEKHPMTDEMKKYIE
jgi:hypothetical protein